MSAELSARRTAARAALADYRRNNLDMIGRALWADRLAVELGGLLDLLSAEAAPLLSNDEARLTEIRGFFAAFNYGTSDLQYALETVERMAGEGR